MLWGVVSKHTKSVTDAVAVEVGAARWRTGEGGGFSGLHEEGTVLIPGDRSGTEAQRLSDLSSNYLGSR